MIGDEVRNIQNSHCVDDSSCNRIAAFLAVRRDPPHKCRSFACFERSVTVASTSNNSLITLGVRAFRASDDATDLDAWCELWWSLRTCSAHLFRSPTRTEPPPSTTYDTDPPVFPNLSTGRYCRYVLSKSGYRAPRRCQKGRRLST